MTDVEVRQRGAGDRAVRSKPDVILEYNQSMGGVDQSDMMLYAYLNERRTVKYWKKVAFRTVNSMFVNAYIINKQNTNATRPLTKYQLYVQAVESLVEDYLESAAARNDTNEKPGIKDIYGQ